MKTLFLTLLLLAANLTAQCNPECEGPLPSAEPQVKCPYGFSLSGDFIFWTAREDGLAYATSAYNQTRRQGTVKHPEFEFGPGFKGGLGIDSRHDGWGLYAQYTWLRIGEATSDVRRSTLDAARNGPNWLIDNSPDDLIATASTKWDLKFNSIDLELGRDFFLSEKLSLRPHFGLKGTWQTQDLTADYEQFGFLAPPTIRRMNQEQSYWGVGIRSGVNTEWRIGYCFSIVGDLALSGLWGQFDIDRLDRIREVTDSISQEVLNLENKFHTLSPVMELFMGVRWAKEFGEGRYYHRIDVGWEEQIWWNQNQFFHVYEEGAHGDLTLQGLTIKIILNF